MASVEVTLSETPTVVTPDRPAQRVVVRIVGNPALVVATADGSTPAVPPSSTPPGDDGDAVVIEPVLGAHAILDPPKFGDHMAIPKIQLVSSGNPQVVVSW